MLLARTHAWTLLQKWLIIAVTVLIVAAATASICYYERHYRGPSDAVFLGSWQEFDDALPEGGWYYTFNADYTYETFLMVPRPGNWIEHYTLDGGKWYAGGDFLYLRLRDEDALFTALLPYRIDAVSPAEIRLHWGPQSQVLKRVDPASLSNQHHQ
jgi:hypothetical protein